MSQLIEGDEVYTWPLIHTPAVGPPGSSPVLPYPVDLPQPERVGGVRVELDAARPVADAQLPACGHEVFEEVFVFVPCELEGAGTDDLGAELLNVGDPVQRELAVQHDR